MTVGVGISTVWTSPVIWKLKTNDTNINPLGSPVTTYQVALIAGLTPFGSLISPLFLTKFCDIIGRRNTLMMTTTLMLIGYIGLAYSTHVYMYYIARFIIGLAVGGAVTSTSIFLSEISEDHNRGTIGCFIGLSFPIGNLYVYLVGPLFSVKVLTLICTIPNIINLLCFLTFIPESPYYLASKGNRTLAIKSLDRLRSKNPSEIEKEYEAIVNTLKGTSEKVEGTWSSLLRERNLRRGLIIALFLNLLQQLSGICAILAFAGPLFDASGASLSGDMTAILIGVVKVTSVIFTTAMIERAGRRPLLMVSTLGGSIPHFLLGLFFQLKNNNSPLIDSILWLPIVSVLAFIITYALGLGVIPTAIMSELFPSNVKSKAASICSCGGHTFLFIVTTTFPLMNELFGPACCFWIFCFFELLGFLFVYFLVPEIKGKNLMEVQELLSK